MRDPVFSAKYNAYIRSPEWKAKRREVLKRARGRCEQCREPTPRPHVHHLTYAHLGDEPLVDLLALCKPCHQRCHPSRNLDGRTRRQGKKRTRRSGAAPRAVKPLKPTENERIRAARAREAADECRRRVKDIAEARERAERQPEGWKALLAKMAGRGGAPTVVSDQLPDNRRGRALAKKRLANA